MSKRREHDKRFAGVLGEFKITEPTTDERKQYLTALELNQPSADQETFDLQEEYSYWLIDEMCVLSDTLFFILRSKCEEWQTQSSNLPLRNSVKEIYEILNKLGLIDFEFTANPSEMLSAVSRGYNIHGVNGVRYTQMEKAHGVLGQHSLLEKMKMLNRITSDERPSLKELLAATFFSGQTQARYERKQQEAVQSVVHLINRYRLFIREINSNNGRVLADGSRLSLKSVVERLEQFQPSFIQI